MKRLNQDYLRSATFGIEDALVSTTGVVTGIAASGVSHQVVLLAAIVTVSVEALSMGAGEYLSEKAAHELQPKSHTDNLVLGAIIMLLGYVAGGIVPILPLLTNPQSYIYWQSVVYGLAGLFILGFAKGYLTHVPKVRSALEMLIVGGLATIVGVTVGLLLKIG